jgi:2-aminoadipate transaminase
MRELMPLTARPDIISFAGGLPAPDLFPVDEYRDCLDHVLTTEGRRAMQYGPPYAPLKEALASLMQLRGVEAEPDDIFITNGAQQGLSVVSQLLLNPDSPVIVEQIAFTGVGQVIQERQAMPLTVGTDLDDGMDVDNVEYLLKLTGQVRAIIEVPDFHNPLGVSLAVESRTRLVDLSYRFRTPIVEDDPYGLLRYEGENIPPLKSHDVDGGVIYLGSFSKILAPGLRLGWMIAPRGALSKLTVIKESQDLETSQLTQRAVAEFVQRGLLASHIEKLKTAYEVRRRTMLAALDREFPPEAKWSKPKGGIFIWVTLPEGVDTLDLLPIAVEQEKVAFIPGYAFGINGGGESSMRLNFSNATPELIGEGIKRLGKIVRAAVAAQKQSVVA